jgi:hypothetical protein
MGEKVNLIYSTLTFCTILISLLFSIAYWKRIKKMKYIRLLPFYIAFSFIVDLPYYFHKYLHLNALPGNIFTIVEFLFFYHFYRNVMPEKKIKSILGILVAVFITFLVIMVIFLQNKYPNETFFSIWKTHAFFEVIVIENILLVIPILLYYKSLFNPPFIRNLTNDPIFLIMTGVLFCFSISIPVFLFSRMLAHYDSEVYYYLYMINSIAYITMHIFFIKAYLNIKAYA